MLGNDDTVMVSNNGEASANLSQFKYRFICTDPKDGMHVVESRDTGVISKWKYAIKVKPPVRYVKDFISLARELHDRGYVCHDGYCFRSGSCPFVFYNDWFQYCGQPLKDGHKEWPEWVLADIKHN